MLWSDPVDNDTGASEIAYKNNEVNGILLKDTAYIKELIYKNVQTLEEAKHLLTIQALGVKP